MTNEEKQALIQRIMNIKTSGKANRFEITELAEIALAALTAQPVKCPSFDDYKPHVAEELRAAFIAAIRATGYEVQE